MTENQPYGYGVAIHHEGWFRFVVRQRRRYIGTRRTFLGAMKLAREATGNA